MGLWSAFYTKQRRPDWNIIVIEKNAHPLGASTRNAGFACFGSLTELLDDARTMGEEAMLATFSMRYEGIRRILSLLDPSSISYEHAGGYELIPPEQYARPCDLRNVVENMNALLSSITHQLNTFELANDEIARFGFAHVSALIKNNLEGQLHPGKLVSVLSSFLQKMGVRILMNTGLRSYEELDNETIVYTNHPYPFYTKKLLVCTNHAPEGVLPPGIIRPARGQVIVTAPIPDLAFTGSFHFDKGYYYFRNLGNRVLLGGARNKAFEAEQTTDRSISPLIQEELERFLGQVILPGKKFTIEHRWSGIMGMPAGGEPIVRKLSSRCYCALGLGGIGVAIAPVIGEKTAAMILAEAI